MVETTHVPIGRHAEWWPSVVDPLRQFGSKVADYFSPDADAAASEKHYEINLELPGVAADNIDISLHDHNLVIKGEKKSEHEERGKTFYFTERSYGAFQRTFRLPGDTDPTKITADFKDGVLSVKVAKAAAQHASKKIKVNAA